MAEWLTGWVTGWVTARVTDLDLDAMHQELVAVLRELRHALFVQRKSGVLLPPVGHLIARVRGCVIVRRMRRRDHLIILKKYIYFYYYAAALRLAALTT